MQFKELSVLVFFICAILAQDIDKNPQDEGRDLRDFNQDWRAVDYPTSDTSGWIPHPQTENEEPKRRRIRKRKRRPPVISLTEEESDKISRKKRPERLDQIKEPWEEMSDESSQKSNNRRRLTPIYDETVEITETKTQIYEKIRDPFTALQEAEEKQKSRVETPDLKTLLKQTEGLSLSEVLQQKNLSLSELIKGNRQAISVLAREAETVTENTKYRRLPPSVGLKKEINRNFEASTEGLSSREVMDAQRKRLALLDHKNKLFSDVTKVDVVTEATTEKRIFVPSNTDFEEKLPPVSSKSKSRRLLPVTSAKLNKLVVEITTKIPEKAVTIALEEIFGFDFNTENDSKPDGPFKMSIDLVEMITTLKPINDETNNQSKTTIEELLTTTPTALSEKLKHVTAKEEIMEILQNPVEREHLSRILRTRNMTVEELVQLRERGSSQLHLADIFHNKTREPEPQDEPFIGHINPDSFDDYKFFNRKSKTFPITSEVGSTQPTKKDVVTTKPAYTITSFPTYKIETSKNAALPPFLPVWKQLYPSFFPDVYENNHKDNVITTTTERIYFEEVERLEEIENALADAANGRLKVDLSQRIYDDEEFINLPSGVKSAILASLAIIGLSLLVFLTILVIFKWTQKQKGRLNYTGSFSGSKIRSPILEPDQRRTFRAFVAETLGRRNFYKSRLQSMSGSIWDTEEKKSYVI